jgi:uncharacterized membrane protein YkoI
MQGSKFSRVAPVLAALLLGTAGLAAIAQAPSAPQAPQAPAAPAATLSFQQVIDRVVAQGYSDVREVERKSDKLYEVKARDGQGRRVELYVDARSGEVLREEVKR